MSTCALLGQDEEHGDHAAYRVLVLVLLLLNPRALAVCCPADWLCAAMQRQSSKRAVPGQSPRRYSAHSTPNACQHIRRPTLSVGRCPFQTGATVVPSGAGVSGAISLGGAPEAGSGPGAHPGGVAACRAERRDPGQRPCDERHCAGKEGAARQALGREHGKVTKLLQQCRHGHKLTAAAGELESSGKSAHHPASKLLLVILCADRDRDGLPVDRTPRSLRPL